MIVLDTNVVSEPLRPAPDQRVLDWINRQQPQTLFLTTVNVAELLAGIEKMPVGRRRSDLHDRRAAEIFALVSTQAQVAGNQMDFADAAIAAIASAHGFDVATRNVRDFRDTGVAVIDPWAQ
jgi:predicted nucleic acid-binding protein